jgi:ABC-2 type transport system ATP-binding protein
MLIASNLNKKYGNKTIINGFDLELKAGEIIGFLGPNGAGKTTIMRMLNRITHPDSGSVSLDGHKLTEKDLIKIGYMPEEKGLYPQMGVLDQLIYFGRLRGLSKKEAHRVSWSWLNKFEMGQYSKHKHSALSKGNAQKIQFIVTVLHNPDILILDEPLSGLDPINADLINNSLKELQKEGKSILFSSHRMEQVEAICDRIILINQGHNVADGTLSQLQKPYYNSALVLDLEKAYNPDDFRLAGLEINQLSPFSIQVILGERQSVNQVISYCISRRIELKGFAKSLPTIKEIFIKLTEADNNTQK